MELDDKYAEKFEKLFYSKTNEKEVVARHLQKYFANRSINHALDIGAGLGSITEVLNQYAKHLSIIESNPSYKTSLARQFPDSTLIIDRFENVTLTQLYDIILMNQCLYYIQAEQWVAICRKAHAACAPEGEIIIILNDHHTADLARIFIQYAKLKPHYQWHYMPLDRLEQQLQLLGTVTTIPYSYSVIYKNVQDFTNALLYVAFDLDSEDLLEKTRPDVVEFSESFRTTSGNYVIHIDARIICCSK